MNMLIDVQVQKIDIFPGDKSSTNTDAYINKIPYNTKTFYSSIILLYPPSKKKKKKGNVRNFKFRDKSRKKKTKGIIHFSNKFSVQ